MVIKSSPKKYSQIQLTKILAKETQNLQDFASFWQLLRQQIWYNPTDDNSLRLNYKGYLLFKKLGYKCHEVVLDSQILVNKHLLILERHYPGVYVLPTAQKIILFYEDYVTLIILMGGDLIGYLENLANSSVDK